MALYVGLPLLPFSKKPSLQSSSSSQRLLSHRRLLADFHPICCLSTANAVSSSPARRTANYQPTVWDDNYIQSLPIDFMDEKYIYRRDILKDQVMGLIDKQHDLIEQLELVDALRQLGLQYHFDSEIKEFLSSISSTVNINNLIKNGNLYGSALLFRLLREYDINNASLLRWWKNLGFVCHELNFPKCASIHSRAYNVVCGEDTHNCGHSKRHHKWGCSKRHSKHGCLKRPPNMLHAKHRRKTYKTYFICNKINHRHQVKKDFSYTCKENM